jgi:hypothetical protein
MMLPTREPRLPLGPAPAPKRYTLPLGHTRSGIYVAMVHAADGLRLVVAGASRAELVRRLAEYVRRRAVHMLTDEHARHVRGLLARGEMEAAVETYFGLVGERWDEEWLVTAAVASDAWWSVTAAVDAVAPALDDAPRSREA